MPGVAEVTGATSRSGAFVTSAAAPLNVVRSGTPTVPSQLELNRSCVTSSGASTRGAKVLRSAVRQPPARPLHRARYTPCRTSSAETLGGVDSAIEEVVAGMLARALELRRQPTYLGLFSSTKVLKTPPR